jgi:8-oxo-dGTP pyrophosphatase MutT (NUDIX family)
MDIQFIERLERELEEELPGRSAQIKMAPYQNEVELEVSENHTKACVLALLFPKNNDWYITLIERASDNENDPHAGQLSFPGGRFEESDYSYQDCALRETEEELGILSSEIGVLGELSSIYIARSNYLIFPFVGFLSGEPDFNPQKSEVANIITLPIKEFLDQKNKGITVIKGSNFEYSDVPYYNFHKVPLWGATAMIMSEFESLLKKIM